MAKRIIFLVFALALILPLVLVGCGEEAPAAPQILRANLAGEPPTIDPNKASWADSRSVITQCFQGLLAFNQDLTLKADVAKEIPTVGNGGISSDGKTYTFKLRNNVKWSDGEKVTADDFEYSIKRFFDPDLACEYASMYYNIVGAEEYNAAADQSEGNKTSLRDAVGVTAVDDYTLKIELINAQPTFLQLMALWPVYPLREDIITQYGDQWTEPPNYIGNGPFILTEWVHQDHLTFKVNENYWGTKPKLSEIQYKIITDVNAELAAYMNNELDMSRVPVGSEKTTMADPVLGKEIVRYNELVTFALQFNVSKPPFNNKLLRQALSCAIDRVAFVDKVRNGVGTPAVSFIPPGMPGYDADLGTEYEFNVDRAKDLLAQAGYSDLSKLPELKYQYADSAGNRLIVQFLQGQLQDNLGITITLEPMEPKAFSQLVNAEQHTWAWFGWGADYPDPENFMVPNFVTDAGNNHTTYSSAEFDAVCDEASFELDYDTRMELWADAAQIVSDDAPLICMFYRERFWLAKPYVKNLKTTGMDATVPGDMFFIDTYLSE